MLMLTYFNFSRHNRENDLFLWVTGNNTFKAIKYRHSDQLRAIFFGLHCELNQFQKWMKIFNKNLGTEASHLSNTHDGAMKKACQLKIALCKDYGTMLCTMPIHEISWKNHAGARIMTFLVPKPKPCWSENCVTHNYVRPGASVLNNDLL